MSTSTIQPADIKIFSDAATAFFNQSTARQAHVKTAYLLPAAQNVIWDDYQGMIALGGDYRGTVTFSASRGLLSHVLLLLGEGDYSDASHRDIVGEIANQMSGYARRHFGQRMDISPPRILTPHSRRPDGSTLKVAPYAIPLSWDGYEAHLVVQMANAA